MNIPFANSIRFRKIDTNYPNFDNTLVVNEKFFNDKIFPYCQRFLTTDTVTVQMKSNSATVPTVVLYDSEMNETAIVTTLVSSYDQDSDGSDDLFFFEFDVVMATLTDEHFLRATQGSDVFVSEPFKADSDLLTELQNGQALQIQYSNIDNALQIDFSDFGGTKTPITFTIYVEGTLKDFGFGGESSVYDNQDELTKIKETMIRLLTLKTLHIPRYMAETLRIASGFDMFVINGVSFVREDLPEVAAVDGSNLVELSMTLNDKEYLGVNSHDIGFDCDTSTGEIMILTEENASGSVSFNVPAGYLVHTMRIEWVSGTSVEAKLGTTLAGDELVLAFNVNSSFTMVTTAIHGDINRGSDSSIYATITGGVANIDIQLIQNTQ
jgi:hypothetical protein